MVRMLDLGDDNPAATTSVEEEGQGSERRRRTGPLVTLFTDASYCPRSRIGGWAAWAKFETGTLRVSAPFRDRLINNGVAEMCAIANGLYAVVRRFEPLPEGTTILAQTDSTHAIRVLEQSSGAARGTAEERQVKQTVFGMLERRGLRLVLRHVKGHRGYEDRRSAVNTWADRAARDAMREAREVYEASLLIPPDV